MIVWKAAEIRNFDGDFEAATCCGGRVHLRCFGGLSEQGNCPLCEEDYCTECHLACNPLSCQPRRRTEAADQDTKYDTCQNPPFQRRTCGHTACHRHFEQDLCSACTERPAPHPNSQNEESIPDALIGAPHSPARSEGEDPGPFEYGSEDLTACHCGGIRNLFECNVCGPVQVPPATVDVHLVDLFAALHNNRRLFVDALMGQSNGALNAISRFSSMCPSCGTAVSKTHPGRPACDAMLCTMCHTHFCFYCQSQVPDSYNLPGHGPHYGNHTFERRSAAVRNGWCLQRQREPASSTVRPPRVFVVPPVSHDVVIRELGLSQPSLVPAQDVATHPHQIGEAAVNGRTSLPGAASSSGAAPAFVPPELPRVVAPVASRLTGTTTPVRVSVSVAGRQRSRVNAAARNRRPASVVQAVSTPSTRAVPRPQTVSQQAPTRRVKVLPYVPKNLWALFQDVCRPIFADLERAAACNNAAEVDFLLKELLDVPAHTLSVRRGGRRLESGIAARLRAVTITRAQPRLQEVTRTLPLSEMFPSERSKIKMDARSKRMMLT